MIEGYPTPRWDKTHSVVERLRFDPNFEEPDLEALAGYFGGRRIIARNSPINGGVYVGAGYREAIVVDDAKGLEVYNEVYNRFLNAVYSIAEFNPYGTVLDKVLKPAYAVTSDVLPFNSLVVNRIAAGKADKKINLAKFISEGAGVCRHQALLTAYLLERARQEGELVEEDAVSIDRNYIPGRGGHAWVRYTSSDWTPYIIDPAQRVIGPLRDLSDAYWDYRRPGEDF